MNADSLALVLLLGCAPLACATTPRTVAPSTAASPEPTAEPSEPTAASTEPEAAPAETNEEAMTGIDACDRYLVAYQKCEPKLQPEIQAGNRRSYEAEKNWLVFMRERPEGKELAAACASMQTELDKSCP